MPLLLSLFAIYLALLAWAILWKLEVPYVGAAAGYPRPFKIIPFVPSGDAGASEPLELLANVLLFVPFGIYLGLLVPRWRTGMRLAAFAAASLLLELTQHVLSTGSFDVTDVIVNTVGGCAGLGLLVLLRRRYRERITTIMMRGCLIGTVLALIAVGVFLVSPVRYSQPQDVIVPSSS
jgi:glycopeptide antibiotics resistance protein